MKNNLAIIGSRTFNNYSFAAKKILEIIKNNKISIDKIVSGGANGADKIAEKFANNYNIPIIVIKPDWNNGKHSGLLRNTDIVNNSNFIIAFWDGKSKGTLDTINKAKKSNKKVFVINVSNQSINEGISLGDDGEYKIDFKSDNKDDLLTLTYNKNYTSSKTTNGLVSYYSYKINKKSDKKERFDLLTYLKGEFKESKEYQNMLNKAITGLFNNPNLELSDVDLILIPQSSSDLNLEIASRIKAKIPNALFIKDGILKNEPSDVKLDYDKLKTNNISSNTILQLEKMIEKSTINGVFKIKKIAPRFRRYVYNFLKIDITNKKLLNKMINGKVLIVDDITTEGTTFTDINKLIDNYSPKEIIYYSLIA